MNPNRKPLVAANWKMFKTIAEAISFVKTIQEETGPCDDREVVIAPPYTALKAVRDIMKQRGYSLAAQNSHWEEKGAFTGEVSPVMLKDIGCEYTIVGHSERRQLFGETDRNSAFESGVLFKAGIVPVICVGEVLDQREQGKTFESHRQPGRWGTQKLEPCPGGAAGNRLRTGLGDRYGQDRHTRTGAGGSRFHS